MPQITSNPSTYRDTTGYFTVKDYESLKFSENAKDINVGTAVPYTMAGPSTTDIKANLNAVSSNPNLSIEKMNLVVLPNGPTFIITINNVTAAQLGDTVKINLNQFEGSEGTNLTGSMVLTYTNTGNSGFPNQWKSSIEQN
ncbi:hypothetical protein DV702_16595 [Sporosarcina sp. PTS2304]|uniref:hypothetical protein n=1 Tax=Sporosarcina sp. PTS2304 TaxID=2283194 RepID=UPI000E0D7930|nr:hypothetical protein [Sporosarcina sp. PTS2304]AXI01197.1 hypothetical protein DV702_16595 [Sporosarcina sp. PTS2304]